MIKCQKDVPVVTLKWTLSSLQPMALLPRLSSASQLRGTCLHDYHTHTKHRGTHKTQRHLNWSGINLQVGKPPENVNIKIRIIQPKRTTYFQTNILVAGLFKDSPPPAFFYIRNLRIIMINAPWRHRHQFPDHLLHPHLLFLLNQHPDKKKTKEEKTRTPPPPPICQGVEKFMCTYYNNQLLYEDIVFLVSFRIYKEND